MLDQKIPLPINELLKLRKPIRNINVVHKERLSVLEKFALWITVNVGSAGFFILIMMWTLGWFVWNTLGPVEFRFDPFPAFVFWLFLANILQVFLMPLIMIGQNLQDRHAEARAEAEFETNTRAEREVEAILLHLEELNKQISDLQAKISK